MTSLAALLLVLGGSARADPVGLRTVRAPSDGPSLVLGTTSSAAQDLGDRAAVDVSTKGLLRAAGPASVAAAAGWRLPLSTGPRGGGWELVLHAGLGLPVKTPGLFVEAGGAVVGRVEGRRLSWAGSLAVPAAVRVAGPSAVEGLEARLPVLLGTSLGVALTPAAAPRDARLGPLLEVGPALSASGPAALAGTAGVVLTIGPASPTPGPGSEDVTGS